MDGLHDIVLIAIIGAIILVQIYVFVNNYRKIQDYKKTIEKTQDFKIVEVAVPEEWIKEVEVDDILRNPEAFQNSSSEFSSKMTEAPETEAPEEEPQLITKPEYVDEIPEEEIDFHEEEELLDEEEEFHEELEFPDTSNDEAYDDDFEYEEYKNNKR